MRNKPILIVAGEPNSVFLEIFFKTVKKKIINNPIILIVSKDLFLKQMKRLSFNCKINLINENNINFKKIDNKKINIINVTYKFKNPFEKITDKSNKYLTKCFSIALQLLKKNEFLGLINGPISKKNFLKEKYLGITEYLATKTKRENKVAMLIYNRKLSVSPLTTHLPLRLVPHMITKKKIINQVELINQFYKKEFKKNPKIAVTGLNPHCESNYKSSEENKTIIPTIKLLNKKNIKIEGPFAADTIFLKEQLNKYDVIIGMYHDQVLTPIKTLFGFEAINITLGLPFIRISPDHGPNVKMLGKNKSNPESLIQAIKFLTK
jgi:4-hydroxythreonine-4-phosphate dehydrogenase